MLERIAVHIIYYALQGVILHEMESLCQFAFRHSIERKYIKIDASGIVDVSAFYESGAAILYLCERKRIVVIVFRANHLERSRKPFLAVFHQKVVVASWHGYVKVIVPWDESLVTDSAEQCAGNDVIAKSVCLAHLIYGEKYAKYA